MSINILLQYNFYSIIDDSNTFSNLLVIETAPEANSSLSAFGKNNYIKVIILFYKYIYILLNK